MKDFGLFAERDAARAERKLSELNRFAARREIMLETIDLDALAGVEAVPPRAARAQTERTRP